MTEANFPHIGCVQHDCDKCKSQVAEIENLHTVMMAAAVEITEHWDAHCDSEGYGPVNLVRRLENGFPEQYGYDAQTLVHMEKRLEDQAAEIDRLRSLLVESDSLMHDLCASVRSQAAEIEGWKADQKENLRNQCDLHAEIERLKQEPVRDIPHGWIVNWPSPNGGTKPVYHASSIKPKFGDELDGSLTMYAVYTRPAPRQEQAEPDLAMMVRNLVRICRRHIEDDHPDLTKANDCLKWLQSKGLAGSPLRDLEK